MRADSSRQKVVSGFDAVKFCEPDWKPGVGNGKYVFSKSCALGSILPAGITFPANGIPVSGSWMTRDGRSALKSPSRSVGVATCAVRVPPLSIIRLHSCDQKKNTRSFFTGPPKVYPKLL